MLEMMAIRLALKKAIKYIHHYCCCINSGLFYQQTRRNTFSQPMHRGMENTPLMPGIRYCDQSFSYSRQIQHNGRQSFEIGQASQNRMGFGSICSELRLPNAQLPQCGFVCNNHKLPLYVSPVPDNHVLVTDTLSMDWNYLHTYAFPPTILIPSVLAKIRQSQCRIVLFAPL